MEECAGRELQYVRPPTERRARREGKRLGSVVRRTMVKKSDNEKRQPDGWRGQAQAGLKKKRGHTEDAKQGGYGFRKRGFLSRRKRMGGRVKGSGYTQTGRMESEKIVVKLQGAAKKAMKKKKKKRAGGGATRGRRSNETAP